MDDYVKSLRDELQADYQYQKSGFEPVYLACIGLMTTTLVVVTFVFIAIWMGY